MPPPVWTNAAHRNGVRCLGTVITEWLEGILETEELVTGPGQVYTEDPNAVDRRWYSRIYADKLGKGTPHHVVCPFVVVELFFLFLHEWGLKYAGVHFPFL